MLQFEPYQHGLTTQKERKNKKLMDLRLRKSKFSEFWLKSMYHLSTIL